MPKSYDEAVAALYQAPHEAFAAERQRLAAEFKATGDKLTAARFAKLARPTISAWAVNQLWWHARAEFDAFFESATELRSGQLDARAEHRQAAAKLSGRARKLLSEAGHAASEATVRRVEATLAALAATGSFAPDPAGALAKDRDPPGFEAFADSSESAHAPQAVAKPKPSTSHEDAAATKQAQAAEAQRAREAAEAERKRLAEARAKQQAERRAAETTLRDAKHELSAREQEHERIGKELAAAEHALEKARAALHTAEERLAKLTDDD